MSTALAHPLVFQQRRPGWAITAVALLHLALLWSVMLPVQRSVRQDQRAWIQLLQPRQLASVPQPPPRQASPAPAKPPASRPKPTASPLQTPPASAPEDAPPSEPAPAAPMPEAVPLAQRALQAAGAIDRQLRGEHPQEFTAPPDTPQTRLAKGFAEAHAAVKPKWHEAARIELWSAPNDPQRIYRVITATGEYCIYMPDKGNMTLNLSARSGHAGFGGGTAAPCPIRF
ncbi:hypothetical protein [Janthinobacterium psychrotolerans]|uniref:Uncharacterized protein n=1 Tax=Janthinobacterium psychrotolerans TaxID=1747903 RepID=A0A1A7BVL0_9BURK|nr:hypothetical protein [Janthinobacterium psychrotolerans]OBV36799.1 hypothetical protein ASR47_1001273 [Janthinobacterium psychrotolerans]